MSSAIPQPPTGGLMAAVPAANADEIGERAAAAGPSTETTGGWDAYDVWRRFIKDARDRRRNAPEAD